MTQLVEIYNNRPSEPDICAQCGYEHRTPFGKPSCICHKARRADDGGLQPCLGFRIRGFDKCVRHDVSNTPQHKAKVQARQQKEAAQRALSRAVQIYGVPREVDPVQGLLESYWRSAGVVAKLEAAVSTLTREDMLGGVISERTKVTVASPPEGMTEWPEGVEPPHEIETVTTRGARQHAWVREFNAERDRFEKLAETIIKLDLETRRDEYVRAQVGIFASLLAQIDLTDEQRVKMAGLLRNLVGHTFRLDQSDMVDGEVL